MASSSSFARTVGFAVGLSLAASVHADPGPFDGRWSVTLVCADTTDRNGPVKGYTYTFAVSIDAGALTGQYGTPGQPASVVYTGSVRDDGALEIEAAGNTGHAEYAVGQVARGTRYGYSMRGRLTGATGQATRREVRPCTATFVRASEASHDVASNRARRSHRILERDRADGCCRFPGARPPMIHGTCLCGATHWTFDGQPEHATSCNCTACRRYGVLWAYDYEGERIRVEGPTRGYARGDALTFHFCETCGGLMFWRARQAKATVVCASRSTCGWPDPRWSPASRSIGSTACTATRSCRTTVDGSRITGSSGRTDGDDLESDRHRGRRSPAPCTRSSRSR